MFKVSLLPASYRKLLDGRKKKDLILRVAVIVLMCMLIIYSGFAIRLFILKAQLKEIQRNNAVITAQVSELEQYKSIYDSLIESQKRVESVLPKSPSAVKFLSLIQANRPEYAEFTVVSVQEWSTNPVCAIEGTLPAAQNIGDAVSQLRDLEEIFKTADDFKDVVTQVRVINNGMPSVQRDSQGNETYSFRIYVAVGGSIVLDESGSLVTTTTTTTTATETTTAAETTTESTTAEETEE